MAVIPLTIGGLTEAKQQLKDLQEAYEQALTPKSASKSKKELDALTKEVNQATKAFDELNESGTNLSATFEEIYGEGAKPLTNQIGELEDRLYSMALAGEQNTQEFKEISEQVGKLKGTIIDVDKSIDLLSENRGLSVFSTGLGQVGERLIALDFEGASRDAKALNDNIGNLSKIGKSAITGLAKTVGQLSKAFVRMGVALLANPVFLLAVAITAIVVAIGALLNELGFLQPILDGISWAFGLVKDAIDQTIQSIKDLLDWLGLTNYAAQEFADAQIEAFGKVAEKAQEMGDARTKAIDQEIRLNKIAGKSTEDAEIRKQKVLIQTQKILAETARRSLEANEVSNSLTEDQIKKLEEQLKTAETLISDSEFEIKAIKAQSDADEDKRREDQLNKDRENYKKRLAEQKKFEQDRLNTARKIEDLRLQVVEQGLQRDLALNQLKYERLIEDTLANETLLEEEKQQIIDLLKEQADAKAEEIALKDEEKAKAKRDKEAEDQKAIAEQIKADAEKATSEDTTAKETQLQKDIKYNEARLEADQKLFDAKLGLAKGLVGGLSALAGENERAQNAFFLVDKALAIGEVIINTQREIAGYYATYSLIPGGAAIASTQALGAKIRAATSIASIVATSISKFKSGGGGGGGGAIPTSGGGGATSTTPAQPSFELFGQNNDANNLSAPQDVESNQTIEVKAFVSETDVTNSQNKIKKMNESATL